MMRAPRAEITAVEKDALGRLMADYTANGKGVRAAPADPLRAIFDALTKRGGWVTTTEDGAYKITNYGIAAYYTARIVRSVR